MPAIAARFGQARMETRRGNGGQWPPYAVGRAMPAIARRFGQARMKTRRGNGGQWPPYWVAGTTTGLRGTMHTAQVPLSPWRRRKSLWWVLPL